MRRTSLTLGQWALLVLSIRACQAASGVVCWGQGDHGETSVPEGLEHVVQLVAGWAYTCALSQRGAVTCWGRVSSWGATPATGIARLIAGETHVCGLTAAGLTHCWGSNTHNQTDVPADLPPVTDLALSTFSTCALTHQGAITCWGRTSTQPPNVPRVAADLAVGWFHGCATDPAGAVSCWGSQQDVAQSLQAFVPSVKLQARSRHTCSLSASGLVHCWDGRGLTEVPEFADPVAELVLGDEHRCARTRAGSVVCWGTISGASDHGQLNIPGDLGSVAQLVAGPWHTCAVTKEAGVAKCWGMDVANQSRVPNGLDGLSVLALGAYHTCAYAEGRTTTATTTAPAGYGSTPTSSSTTTGTVTTTVAWPLTATSSSLTGTSTASFTQTTSTTVTAQTNLMVATTASSTPTTTSTLSRTASLHAEADFPGTISSTTTSSTMTLGPSLNSETADPPPAGFLHVATSPAPAAHTDSVVEIQTEIGGLDYGALQVNESIRAAVIDVVEDGLAEMAQIPTAWIQSQLHAARRLSSRLLRTAGGVVVESVIQLNSPAAARNLTLQLQVEGSVLEEAVLAGLRLVESISEVLLPCSAITVSLTVVVRNDPEAMASTALPGCKCETGEVSPIWQLLSLLSVLAAFALAGLALLRGRQLLPLGSTGPLPDEREFQGKLGHLNVAVVSCPGAADEDFGQGEIYSLVIRMQGLPVSVVYFGKAHINEFWHIYTRALKNFAVGKKYLVVLTRQNGDIGNIQKQEVTYLAGCDGRKLGDLPPRPVFRGKQGINLLAMTFRELVAWWRLNFDETSLGQELPAHVSNQHVDRLPSLQEMKQRFEDLAMGATPEELCGVH